MGSDGLVELNLGKGGVIMDETKVIYATDPTERLRSRVQIAGCLPDELAEVLDVDPTTLATEPHGLVVRNIPSGIQTVALQLPGDPVFVFAEITSVSSGTETTVASHIVSVGKTFHLIGFVAGGTVDACFTAYISPAATFLSGERAMIGRTSVAHPTIQVGTELATPTGSAGDTVAVRVEHNFVASADNFEVTLLGYEI